uniref:Uncharacterized protein n=1 Tax=Eutreptiella gymnastica TaxID=73025 RepID=A0A7S4G0K3_9EUGL
MTCIGYEARCLSSGAITLCITDYHSPSSKGGMFCRRLLMWSWQWQHGLQGCAQPLYIQRAMQMEKQGSDFSTIQRTICDLTGEKVFLGTTTQFDHGKRTQRTLKENWF